MTRLENILKSGCIVCELGRTVQTDDSHVYSINYHGKDELGDYILIGYAQTTNTEHNSIVNKKPMHVFDVRLLDENYDSIEYIS